jgi:polar amino acid transport system substrate-binding protein
MKRKWLWSTLFAGLMVMLGMSLSSEPVHAAQKTYTIGTDVTFAPFEFADKNNKYVGIDIDLMNAVAKTEGFKVDIKPLGFNAAVQALEAGQIDGVIAGMSITPERQQKFFMSSPYYQSGVVMAVAKGSKIQSLSGLRGKKVAVKTGTASADYANSVKKKYGFTVVTFDDSNNVYDNVKTNNAQACFEDKPVMQYAIATSYKGSLELAKNFKMASANNYGIAVKSSEANTLGKQINAGIKKA